jgi:hypothetical protein
MPKPHRRRRGFLNWKLRGEKMGRHRKEPAATAAQKAPIRAQPASATKKALGKNLDQIMEEPKAKSKPSPLFEAAQAAPPEPTSEEWGDKIAGSLLRLMDGFTSISDALVECDRLKAAFVGKARADLAKANKAAIAHWEAEQRRLEEQRDAEMSAYQTRMSDLARLGVMK